MYTHTHTHRFQREQAPQTNFEVTASRAAPGCPLWDLVMAGKLVCWEIQMRHNQNFTWRSCSRSPSPFIPTAWPLRTAPGRCAHKKLINESWSPLFHPCHGLDFPECHLTRCVGPWPPAPSTTGYGGCSQARDRHPLHRKNTIQGCGIRK